MLSVDMTGRKQLAALAVQINAAADKGIRRELTKALNKATEPAKTDVRTSALSVLPSSGGLAELVAASRITTRTSLRGRNPSVRITQRLAGHDLKAIDRGRVRTPWGRKGPNAWQTQSVPAGYFTDPMTRNVRRTRREVVFAMQDVARMVTRG